MVTDKGMYRHGNRASVLGLLLLVTASCAAEPQNLVPFQAGSRWGFVNENLEVVIPPLYRRIQPFEGFDTTCVQSDPNRWLVIDRTGTVLHETRASYCWNLLPGLHAFNAERGTSIVGPTGELIVGELANVYAVPISEPPIPVRYLGLGWTYLTPSGDKAFDDSYFLRAYPFEDDYSIVVLQGWEFAILNADGSTTTLGELRVMNAELSEGVAPVIGPDGSGFIDTSGDYRFRYPFFDATPMNGDRTLVQTDETDYKWAILDGSGTEIATDLPYYYTTGFEGAVAKVHLSPTGRWTIIDREGNRVTEQEFDRIHQFVHGYASVVVGERTGLLSADGHVTWAEEILD